MLFVGEEIICFNAGMEVMKKEGVQSAQRMVLRINPFIGIFSLNWGVFRFRFSASTLSQLGRLGINPEFPATFLRIPCTPGLIIILNTWGSDDPPERDKNPMAPAQEFYFAHFFFFVWNIFLLRRCWLALRSRPAGERFVFSTFAKKKQLLTKNQGLQGFLYNVDWRW